MAKQILVSIIIAVYNAEKRIEKVIDSLLQQNYAENYEIILVDDGSKDKSLRIMLKYEKKYNNLKVIAQKNKGAAFARNTGIKNSKGQYLVITDDDVLLGKNWLKKTIPILKDKKIGFVVSVIKNNKPQNLTKIEDLLFDYAASSRNCDLNNEGVMLMSNAIKKEAIKQAGLYDVQFGDSGSGADIDIVQRIRKKGYLIGESPAIATHLEEKERFILKFFITKPFEWGKKISKLRKNGFKEMTKDKALFLLVYPFPIIAFMLLLILSFFNIWFLTIFVLGFFIHILMRKKMISSLMKRKRNIFEIIFLLFLDILRVGLYNLGSFFN